MPVTINNVSCFIMWNIISVPLNVRVNQMVLLLLKSLNVVSVSMSVYICDRACENQLCERKLHQVIFSAISSALNVVSHFSKFQKKAH